jgi:hypothetical protein
VCGDEKGDKRIFFHATPFLVFVPFDRLRANGLGIYILPLMLRQASSKHSAQFLAALALNLLNGIFERSFYSLILFFSSLDRERGKNQFFKKIK